MLNMQIDLYQEDLRATDRSFIQFYTSEAFSLVNL